jgi:hypothetical protein
MHRTQVTTASQSKSKQVKASQIKSKQVKANQSKSKQVKASQIKSNQVKSKQVKASQSKSKQIKASQAINWSPLTFSPCSPPLNSIPRRIAGSSHALPAESAYCGGVGVGGGVEGVGSGGGGEVVRVSIRAYGYVREC